MRDLLENDDIEPLGELLDHNWRLKRKMAVGISDFQIDGWYKKGILAGATGGKLLGAGNGGFMMFFAPKEKHAKITKAMKDLQRVPFSFDNGGSKIVFSDQIKE
jgi:D-glycero-alpha-D-manno-heptose-7-phosphate kinase